MEGRFSFMAKFFFEVCDDRECFPGPDFVADPTRSVNELVDPVFPKIGRSRTRYWTASIERLEGALTTLVGLLKDLKLKSKKIILF